MLPELNQKEEPKSLVALTPV